MANSLFKVNDIILVGIIEESIFYWVLSPLYGYVMQ